MRRTKIICTIGPKTENEDMIKLLAEHGMDIARINMSHGHPDWHSSVMNRIKKISEEAKFPIGLMLDTQGPEIRTSSGTEIGLNEGDIFKIAVSSACDIQEGEKHTFVDYETLINKVKEQDIILIDEGKVSLKIIKVEPYHITCKVLNKGKVGHRKSVNIPGIKSDLPAITQKDIEDVKLGAQHEVDFVAQSFVRKKQDIADMRGLLKKYGSDAVIIAKIEDEEGVSNMDEVVEEADGVMVARGDLGVQIPFENLPVVQKQIVGKCIEKGKPVIIATHLLESMVYNPRPTRAEVTDIANAVFEKADCIMLSAETTKGSYPLECVNTMDRVIREVQTRLKLEIPSNGIKTKDAKEAITLGACINAESLDAKAIVAFSKTGRLLKMITKNRPNRDIFAFTEDEKVRRKLMICWGTYPFKMEFSNNFEAMISDAVKILKENKFISKGDRIITVSDVDPRKNVDVMEIREVE